MTVETAREILGEKAEKINDRDIVDMINFMEILAKRAIDLIYSMSDERLKQLTTEASS